MDFFKDNYYKRIDLYFLEIVKYRNKHNDFWCGYSLAIFQEEVINAFNKGIITLKEKEFLDKCARYISIII